MLRLFSSHCYGWNDIHAAIVGIVLCLLEYNIDRDEDKMKRVG